MGELKGKKINETKYCFCLFTLIFLTFFLIYFLLFCLLFLKTCSATNCEPSCGRYKTAENIQRNDDVLVPIVSVTINLGKVPL